MWATKWLSQLKDSDVEGRTFSLMFAIQVLVDCWSSRRWRVCVFRYVSQRLCVNICVCLVVTRQSPCLADGLSGAACVWCMCLVVTRQSSCLADRLSGAACVWCMCLVVTRQSSCLADRLSGARGHAAAARTVGLGRQQSGQGRFPGQVPAGRMRGRSGGGVRHGTAAAVHTTQGGLGSTAAADGRQGSDTHRVQRPGMPHNTVQSGRVPRRTARSLPLGQAGAASDVGCTVQCPSTRDLVRVTSPVHSGSLWTTLVHSVPVAVLKRGSDHFVCVLHTEADGFCCRVFV